MEEGREGAQTKGLQKSHPWYRGRLTTPRNHPHTLYRQWALGDLAYVSMRVRTWFFTQLWCRMLYGYNTEKTICTLSPTKLKYTIEYQPPSCADTQILNHS